MAAPAKAVISLESATWRSLLFPTPATQKESARSDTKQHSRPPFGNHYDQAGAGIGNSIVRAGEEGSVLPVFVDGKTESTSLQPVELQCSCLVEPGVVPGS